jgi:hypothetical protein
VRSLPVTVEKRRWSGAASTFIATTLHRLDDWGLWLVAPPLTPHLNAGGWIEHVQAIPILGLFPPDRHFTAWFKPHGGKVDLCASNDIDLVAGTAVFVDVDLDLAWEWKTVDDVGWDSDRPVRVLDQEEFAALHMHDALRADIRREAALLRHEIEEGTPPFGDASRDIPLLAWPGSGARSMRDGFTPLGADVVPQAYAAFGSSLVDAWARRERDGNGWILMALHDGEVVGLVWVDGNDTAVITAAPHLVGTRSEDLIAEAGVVASAYPPPPSR